MQLGRGLAVLALLQTVSWGAEAPRLPIAVALRFDHHQSRVAERWMRVDLARLMGDTVSLEFMDDSPTPGSVSSRLIIVNLHGYCSLDASDKDVARPSRSLAFVHVSEGVILPFVEVQCDRVRASVHHIVGTGDPHEHEYLLGAALAKVISHELYHILSGCVEHTASGLTKSTLTPAELISGTDAMPALAANAIQQASALGR